MDDWCKVMFTDKSVLAKEMMLEPLCGAIPVTRGTGMTTGRKELIHPLICDMGLHVREKPRGAITSTVSAQLTDFGHFCHPTDRI